MQAFIRICNGVPLRFLGTDVAFSWYFWPIYGLGLTLAHPFIDFSRLDIGYFCYPLAFRCDFIVFRHFYGHALMATFAFSERMSLFRGIFGPSMALDSP